MDYLAINACDIYFNCPWLQSGLIDLQVSSCHDLVIDRIVTKKPQNAMSSHYTYDSLYQFYINIFLQKA